MDLIQQDIQQRTLALDATKSFIVQAPAGSGKTELLIQRFLTLLTQVKKPEEILAITFTKKAANEMRLRLLKALKQAETEKEPESAHAKQTWRLATTVLKRDRELNWDLLNNPNQLRIQTIDSLCSFLTKQLPLLSHFGSQPDITDNANSLYREAVTEVLSHVEGSYEWSQAISKLLLHLDNDLNKLHDLFVNLLAKRDQWLPYIHLDKNAVVIRQQLEAQLAAIVNDHLQMIVRLFPQELYSELLSIAEFSGSPRSNVSLPCDDNASVKSSANLSAWRSLASLLLTKTGTWRKQLNAEIGFPPLASLKNPEEKRIHTEYRQRFSELITKLGDHEDLRLALAELAFLPQPFYEDSQWEILQSLLSVLKILAAQLRLTFQQYGQIDFIENAHAALAALGNHDSPTDLALALDYQIWHILVDEFQDTSYTQYQLLEKLTWGWENNDGRTLFVVGDPMQSIYRFREAEVGLFIRMRSNGIGQIKLMPLTLARNFRSLDAIVTWNNTHFTEIFPSFNDIATGAVTYSPSISTHQSHQQDKHVSLKGFCNFADDAQANYIVKLIQEIRLKEPTEKIAILVRSRSHLTRIIPTLKKAHLPFRAIDIDPLASRQHIQDLLALTCALFHPADRIAWLTVLRAPWCGLSLADLLIIAGSDAHATLLEQIDKEEIQTKLSADGKQRLHRIIPILKNKLFERDRDDLRTWIESIWQLLGGPASLKDASDINDANEYFNLLNEVTQSGQILNIEKLKEKIAKLFAVSQHDDNSLQIMTIHSAKGLEFDTVILPHLERKMPLDDKSLLLWLERPLTNTQTALLLAPIHKTGSDKDTLYEFINRQHKIKSEYEIDRLFYVATTRAKKHLHLLFSMQRREQREYTPEHGSFLKKIWRFVEKDAFNLIEENLLIDAPEVANMVATKKPVRRLTVDWHNPIQTSTVHQFTAHKKRAGFLLADNKPKIIGIIIHKILQLLAQNNIHWWQKNDKDSQKNYIISLLRQHNLVHNEIPSAATIILKAIENTLNDERGAWILKSHLDAKCEYALTSVLNSQPINLIVDRTFIDEQGTRWIIDYKTTTFSASDLDLFLADEQEKYLEKMTQYQQALQLIDKRSIRMGLYFPVLSAWKEIG